MRTALTESKHYQQASSNKNESFLLDKNENETSFLGKNKNEYAHTKGGVNINMVFMFMH